MHIPGKILSILLSITMIVSVLIMVPIARVEAATNNTDLVTIYFVNNQHWDNVYIYSYDPEPNAWPGTPMTRVGTDPSGTGIYSAQISKFTGGVVFNDSVGGSVYSGEEPGHQTKDIYSPFDDNSGFYMGDYGETRYFTYNPDYQGSYVRREDRIFGDTMRIYFLNYQSWNNVYVHYFECDSPSSWPGVKMTAVDSDLYGYPIFACDVPRDAGGLVFNNAEGKQTPDIRVNIDPNCGWYLNNSDKLKTFTYFDEPEPTGENITVYFRDDNDWGDVYIYTFDPEAATWPGERMTSCDTDTTNYKTVYKKTIKAGTGGIVFNNGRGTQTSNITKGIFDGAEWYLSGNTLKRTVKDSDRKTTYLDKGDILSNNPQMTRIYYIDNLGWDTVYVHSWDAEGSPEWPGRKMNYIGRDGETDFKIFYSDIPTDSEGFLFHNNNGEQTLDLFPEDYTSSYYTNNRLGVYPVFSGQALDVEEFQYLGRQLDSYVDSTWYPYDQTEKVYFVNSCKWKNVYAYTYRYEQAKWPGRKMKPIGKDKNSGYDIYEVDVNRGAGNLIFNNGEGVQTRYTSLRYNSERYNLYYPLPSRTSELGLGSYWYSQDYGFYPFTYDYGSGIDKQLTQYVGFESSVRIPAIDGMKAITSIGYDAFAGCGTVKSVHIPSTILSVGNNAFAGCTNLQQVYYAGSPSDWQKISFGSGNTNLFKAQIIYAREGEVSDSFNTNYLEYSSSKTGLVYPKNDNDAFTAQLQNWIQSSQYGNDIYSMLDGEYKSVEDLLDMPISAPVYSDELGANVAVPTGGTVKELMAYIAFCQKVKEYTDKAIADAKSTCKKGKCPYPDFYNDVRDYYSQYLRFCDEFKNGAKVDTFSQAVTGILMSNLLMDVAELKGVKKVGYIQKVYKALYSAENNPSNYDSVSYYLLSGGDDEYLSDDLKDKVKSYNNLRSALQNAPTYFKTVLDDGPKQLMIDLASDQIKYQVKEFWDNTGKSFIKDKFPKSYAVYEKLKDPVKSYAAFLGGVASGGYGALAIGAYKLTKQYIKTLTDVLKGYQNANDGWHALMLVYYGIHEPQKLENIRDKNTGDFILAGGMPFRKQAENINDLESQLAYYYNGHVGKEEISDKVLSYLNSATAKMVAMYKTNVQDYKKMLINYILAELNNEHGIILEKANLNAATNRSELGQVTVSAPEGVVRGSTATVTAEPKDNSSFVGWVDTKTGDTVSTEPEYTLVVDRDTNLEAVFVEDQADTASVPVIEHISTGSSYALGQQAEPLEIEASANGDVTIDWYRSDDPNNLSEGFYVGSGESYTPYISEVGSEYYYAVISNTLDDSGIESSTQITSDVIPVEVTSPIVVDLSIDADNTRTEYHLNDTLDKDDISVKATLSDDSVIELPPVFYSATADLTSAGRKQVTVEYEDFTLSYEINVNENEAEETRLPDGYYLVGEYDSAVYRTAESLTADNMLLPADNLLGIYTYNASFKAGDKVKFAEVKNDEIVNWLPGDEGNEYTFAGDGSYRILLSPDRIYDWSGEDGLYADIALITVDEDVEESNINVVGHSLTLKGDIGVNFYLDVADDQVYDGVTVDFSWGEENKKRTSEVTLTPESYDENTGYYKASCFVSASEMTTDITAVVNGHEGETATNVYTVTDYARIILTDNDFANNYINNAGEEKLVILRNLVKSMLNHGAYSQLYFGKKTDNLANADLTEEERQLGDVTVTAEDPVKDLPSYVTFEGATLSLKSETSLSLYFTSAEQPVFSCDSHTVETVKNGDYWVARIRGIPSKNIGDTFTLHVNSGTITYSPLNYVKNVINGDQADEKLINLVKALYFYWQASEDYYE